MTDRELLQQALDALEAHADIGIKATKQIEALRARLAQPEPEPVATLFGSLPVYDVPLEQQPVAWVETLENAQPHCVTDLKYCSVMQHDRGEHLKYTPLYKDPTSCKTCEALARTVMLDQTSHDTKKEWAGLPDEEKKAICQEAANEDWTDLDVINATEAKLREKNV